MPEAVPINQEYLKRINKTIDYIEANFNKTFTLDELAAVSNFSKYHFHRIFQGIIGETPFQFITRIRLERAASLLLANPGLSISDVANRCGYADSSVFSRNFKQLFQTSATDFRAQKDNSNMSQVNRNIERVHGSLSIYFCNSTNTIKWKTDMKTNQSIEIQTLKDMNVAYVRHIGPYKGNDKLFQDLWNKLFTWAGPRGFMNQPDMVSLAVYHDDPNITEDMKLRTSICLTVPEGTKADNEVGIMKIEGGLYVVAQFVVNSSEFAEAWQWMYSTWLPASGYQCDDKPSFERYLEAPQDDKFKVDICIPVKPL